MMSVADECLHLRDTAGEKIDLNKQQLDLINRYATEEDPVYIYNTNAGNISAFIANAIAAVAAAPAAPAIPAWLTLPFTNADVFARDVYTHLATVCAARHENTFALVNNGQVANIAVLMATMDRDTWVQGVMADASRGGANRVPGPLFSYRACKRLGGQSYIFLI